MNSRCLICLIISITVLCLGFAGAFVYFYVAYDKIKAETSDVSKPWQGPGPSASFMPSYRHASVVADAAICAPIGNQFLLVKGGHAVDAAIATLLCNGVVNMHSMGIGGGGLMVIYNRSNQLAETLNFRETAPAAGHKDMFNNTSSSSSRGGLEVAIPSAIAGYRAAHLKYGRLPWKDLFQPTIDLLKKGVPVSPALAKSINDKISSITKYSPELKAMLYDSNKKVWKKEGDFYQNLKLAATLEKIANDPNYHTTDLPSVMAKEIREKNGIMTEQDIRSYTPKWSKTISSNMTKQNLVLHTMSVPCGGALAIYIVNILSGYNFSKRTFDTLEGASLFTHRAVEAMKFAYAKKSFLGDVNKQFIQELVHNLTSPSFAEETRLKITDDTTHNSAYYGGYADQMDDKGTTHINVLDQDGNAVAVTSTINAQFGSFVMGADSGIVYNNEMNDFSKPSASDPSPNNFIAPGKSPMSSMSPIIAVDTGGNVRRIYGASGGSLIISSVGAIMARNLFLNETIKQAIDFPRLHPQLIENHLETEETFPKDIKETLIKRGHKFGPKPMHLVASQGVEVLSDGLIYSNADNRKGGKSDGY